MKTAIEILMELWFGHLNLGQIHQWAEDYIYEYDTKSDDEYFKILDSDLLESEALLLELARKINLSFSKNSLISEVFSAQYLLERLKEYLNNQIKPLVLCNMITEMEVTFLGAPRSLPEGVAYYPEWLGNLWNACDWCDESWTFENSSELKTEIRIQIQKIEEWILSIKI